MKSQSSGDGIIDGDECSLCPDKKDPPVKKEEIEDTELENGIAIGKYSF